MAYQIDPTTNDIVISGFESGIADDPYDGISDLRNVDTITVPGEASVNFKTYKSSPTAAATTFTADAGTDLITPASTTNLGYKVAVTFTTTGTLPAGLSLATPYWLNTSGVGTFLVYPTPELATQVNITGTGTGVHTLTVVTMGKPKYAYSNQGADTFEANQVMVDANGRVWLHNQPFNGNTSPRWSYLGNTTLTNANGNGIVIYNTSTGLPYVFVYRNGAIDYFVSTSNPISGAGTWVYGWNPLTGGSGANAMNNSVNVNNPHESLVGQDNVVYYTDADFVGSFFEKTGQVFDPTNTATYTWAKQALALPNSETAQCLAELGVNLLVGGRLNAIYPWDRTSTSFRYPILIGDRSIVKMVTVNTNTYIFAGIRGRIYITNGSQAQLYKKIPDHLSGTVQPYYTWGGATFLKNQLLFGVSATTNSGSALPSNQLIGYGGVWSIDMDTKAIRLANKLSYNTYGGIATVLEPSLISTSGGQTTPGGMGLLIGWSDGSGGTGSDDSTPIDNTTALPYADGSATVDSDLIPIGTFLKPKQFSQVEYKLSKPLVNGESVQIWYRLDFSQTYSQVLSDSTIGAFSGTAPVNFSNAQWVQLQARLQSTATTPSFVRLKEIRIR